MNSSGSELTQEQIEALVRPIPGDFVVYLLVGRQMKVLFFTDTILSSFGVTAADFTAATANDALDVVMPADRALVLSSVLGKPIGPALIHCRFRLMHREKGFFWVHAKSRIIGTMDGCPVVLTNYLNASAEAESYSRILDDTAAALCTVDIGTHEILYANRAARHFAKLPGNDIYAGHPCYEYLFCRREPCAECPMAALGMGQSCACERCDPEDGRWYAVSYKRVGWLGHDCLEISAEDITEIKTREMEKFRRSVESLLAVNPDSLCTFQINLTKNECGEGHGASDYIRRMLQSDTADGLFRNIIAVIPDSGQQARAAALFDRRGLIAAFESGRTAFSTDYLRRNGEGRSFWVRTYVNMLKNPETQDVIGIFYSEDISREVRQEEIFRIITDEEYDFVALLHTDIGKLEFLRLNQQLPEKYRTAFGAPGALCDYDDARRFAAQSWMVEADREDYLRASEPDALRAELDRSGHCELIVRGRYAGRPDEFMCRKIQHYSLGKGRDTILILQSDVTEAYLRRQKETLLARSEKRQLSDILNRLSAGICVLVMPDAEHVLTSFCNRQMYKLLDLAPNVSSPEELDPDSDALISTYIHDEFSGIHPDDQARVRALFRDGYDRAAFTVPCVRYLGGSGKYKYITIDLVQREPRPEGRVFYAVYRDVSEETALQAALEAQRKKQLELTLMDVIGRLPANYVLYRANGDGTLTPERYSDDFCRMKGCTQADIREFNGENGFAPVHPEDRAALEESVRASRGDDSLHRAVYRILTKDSGYRWVSVNYSYFSVGERRYLYAVYNDIDELKRQEQRLREQYDAAQTYLDSVSGSYLSARRIDLSRNVIESVRGMRPLEEAEGVTDYDAYVAALLSAVPSEADRQRCAALYARENLLARYEQGERRLAIEYPYRTPEEEIVWVRNTISLIRRPGSGDVIAFSSVSNINQEKLIGAIMDTLVTTKYDNISCIDAGSGRVVFYFSPSHTLGEKVIRSGDDYEATLLEYNRRFVVPAERAACAEAMRLDTVLRKLAAGEPCVSVFSVTDGGETRVKQAEFFYVDRPNKLISLVRTDITEAQRQQAEQQAALRAALTAAERANEAKSDFLSRMSHDIRTPLNGIIGMTYLTEKLDLPAQAQENLRKIDTSSQFLLGLINDVLDMSKAESGALELHPEPYNEKAFAKYLEAVIAPLCQEKNIRFVVDAETVPDVDMLLDPLRINQVFFNLLSNAVKFTPEGGTVTYRLREKRLSENRLSINAQVIDTGIGMSEEFIKVLFDPFTQENRNDVSLERGTGLGLSIVKKILDAMGGTVSVASRINEGTTFTVHADIDCVPARAEAGAQGASGAPENDGSLAGRHVLLCEDHPLNREIAVTLLNDRGLHVTEAEDGRIGLELFRKSTPGFYDAILMDIRMPVMDGYEATRALRALDRPDAGTVPIIAMTADAFADDVQKCLDAGMDAHLAKPIDPRLLYETLRTAIAGRRSA